VKRAIYGLKKELNLYTSSEEPSATEITPIQYSGHTLNKEFFSKHCIRPGRWDSKFGIVKGYGLKDRELRVRVLVGARIFSSPCCTGQLWGPPILLSNGYHG
jgi:hypothetical protein